MEIPSDSKLTMISEKKSSKLRHKERLWGIRKGILRRCNNKNVHEYKNYGGRGIKICDEWLKSYDVFREWALSNGYDDSLTIDRIDNDGDYSPENCRWANIYQQRRNRTDNVMLTAFGETKTLVEWFEDERCGVNHYMTLHTRIQDKRGSNPEYDITTPAGQWHRNLR